IVVHRQEMTSFALIAALLSAEAEATKNGDDRKHSIGELRWRLFRNARIGEERVWAQGTWPIRRPRYTWDSKQGGIGRKRCSLHNAFVSLDRKRGHIFLGDREYLKKR